MINVYSRYHDAPLPQRARAFWHFLTTPAIKGPQITIRIGLPRQVVSITLTRYVPRQPARWRLVDGRFERIGPPSLLTLTALREHYGAVRWHDGQARWQSGNPPRTTLAFKLKAFIYWRRLVDWSSSSKDDTDTSR